jgi:uncharacterized membrane protein
MRSPRDGLLFTATAIFALNFLCGTFSRVSSTVYRQQLPSPDAALLLHFAAAGAALVLGLTNLSVAFGRGAGTQHRWLGRLYCVGVALGVVGGAWLVPYTPYGGLLGQFGVSYGLLLWSVFTIAMVKAAREGRMEAHRCWALRSYAIALAGATLRHLLDAGLALGWAPSTVYAMAANACFILNLALVELFWVRGGFGQAAPDVSRETPPASPD